LDVSEQATPMNQLAPKIFQFWKHSRNLSQKIPKKNNEKKKLMKTLLKFTHSTVVVVTLAMGALTTNGAPQTTSAPRPLPTPRARLIPLPLFASINGSAQQNGAGSIYEYFGPGIETTFASGLSHPRGVAFDQVGDLFVATTAFDPNGNGSAAILKILSNGTQTTFANINGPSASLAAADMKFDIAGNLFVMVVDLTDSNLASTIYKFTPDGVQSTFGSVTNQGVGLAFDSAGNLFAASGDQIIYKFAPDGTRSVFAGPSAFDPQHTPAGLAFDRFGDLFVSTTANVVPPPNGAGSILKFTPDGMETTFATVQNYARGLAFGNAGNLYVAEVGVPGSGDILKFTPDGVGTVFAQVPGPVNTGPEYLAFRNR
jgi:hypothetical protein